MADSATGSMPLFDAYAADAYARPLPSRTYRLACLGAAFAQSGLIRWRDALKLSWVGGVLGRPCTFDCAGGGWVKVHTVNRRDRRGEPTFRIHKS